MTFPKDFVWGAASAAYQIEGAFDADGKGPNVWDVFCAKDKAVFEGHTGNVACDHYHRYREDVALMQSLGMKGYRCSISWSRVMPDGVGRVNEKGLEFYERLVDALLEAGIQPYITLFHWDYPLALYQRGGWLNRDSADWFAEYASVIGKRLGDRVSYFMTHNEPQCFVGIGHQSGAHAPGDTLELSQLLRVSFHSLLAHGKGVQALRASAGRKINVGYAPVGNTSIPASDSPDDVAAAHEHMFRADGSIWSNTLWMDPVYLGKFPEDGLQAWGAKFPAHGPEDLKTIHQPLDYFGCNIYFGSVIRRGADGKPEIVKKVPGAPMNAVNWPITPDALYWGPKCFYERYGKPIVITENGMTLRDFVALDGKVHDPHRIDFTQRYLRSLHRAVTSGVPVSGYFHWSILDNFEWAEGYKERFGLIYVDYATQKRTLKDSALWYKKVIESNGDIVLG